MADSFSVVVTSKPIRLRHVLLALLLPMFLFVLWHDEVWLVNHSDGRWAYFYPVRWMLLPHVLGGSIALLTGPFQFSSRFRKKHLRLHRIVGRVYLASVAVSGVFSLYVSSVHQKDVRDREWIFALAILWFATAAIALVAVLNGNIEAHRQWIARNYAFTTVFVTARVLYAIPIPDAYKHDASWMLLLATLLCTEIGLSWRKVLMKKATGVPIEADGLLKL